MKRAVSVFLVMIALGLAAFFFLKVRRYLPEGVRGADLAPAETVLFVQFRDLRQTALRFPKTDLYRIWKEPDVQAFLEKPRAKAPWMVEWGKRLEEMARVAPGEAFIAFTSVEGPRPGFVGGFSYAGRRGQAEDLAAHLCEQLLRGEALPSTSRANWVLFASDADGLARLVGRFEGSPGPALAAEVGFQKAIARLGGGQDLVLYGKPEAFSGRLDFLPGLSGNSPTTSSHPIAMATKIDGEKFRDTIFVPGSGGTATGKGLSRRTVTLASPETLLYYVADLTVLTPDLSMATPLLPTFAAMERSLAEKDLSWDELPQAVASEVGLMIEWPGEAVLPTLLVGAETRDLEKARSFAETVLGPAAAGTAVRTGKPAGIALQGVPPQARSFIRPALAVTDRFALVGFSSEVVESALPRTKSGPATLGEEAVFRDALRFVPKEAAAFGYLDFKRLFERVYPMVRPFITLSLAFSAEAGAQFDAGKLPPVGAISRHLGASMIAQTQTGDGMLIESIGSLTLPELLFAVSAGGITGGLPELPGAAAFGNAKRPPSPKSGTAPKSRVNGVNGGVEAAAAPPSPEKKPAEHK